MTKRTKKSVRRITEVPCLMTFAPASNETPRPTSMNPPARVRVQLDGDDRLHVVADQGAGLSVVLTFSMEEAHHLAEMVGRGACFIWNAQYAAEQAVKKAFGGAA